MKQTSFLCYSRVKILTKKDCLRNIHSLVCPPSQVKLDNLQRNLTLFNSNEGKMTVFSPCHLEISTLKCTDCTFQKDHVKLEYYLAATKNLKNNLSLKSEKAKKK